ncbi:MAG: hypothetical protein ACP5M5_08985 [Acidibrevibacterium sp.]|uniref:hypothetical protein n=1 Tax=Acidibrevibacterium sp. TaxID=2606776 RepID=UPI003D074E97
MKRFVVALAAVLLLAGPAFAQGDQKAQGTEGQTDQKAPNEHHKMKKSAHKKSTKKAAPAANAAPAPAAGGATQN